MERGSEQGKAESVSRLGHTRAAVALVTPDLLDSVPKTCTGIVCETAHRLKGTEWEAVIVANLEPTTTEWLPDILYVGIWPFMQYGVFVTIPIATMIALLMSRRRLGVLLGVSGVGVVLVRQGRLSDVIATVEAIADLERVVAAREIGPCADAMRSRQPVVVGELTGGDLAQRWPEYVAQAEAASAAPVPARAGGLPVIDEGMRRWYESCSCCLSEAYPEIKAALDAERDDAIDIVLASMMARQQSDGKTVLQRFSERLFSREPFLHWMFNSLFLASAYTVVVVTLMFGSSANLANTSRSRSCTSSSGLRTMSAGVPSSRNGMSSLGRMRLMTPLLP